MEDFSMPYPICIVEDRYSGAYSGGVFLAFNMNPYGVEQLPIFAGDNECEAFWENRGDKYNAKDYLIGKGKTPNEAIYDLIRLLSKK